MIFGSRPIYPKKYCLQVPYIISPTYGFPRSGAEGFACASSPEKVQGKPRTRLPGNSPGGHGRPAQLAGGARKKRKTGGQETARRQLASVSPGYSSCQGCAPGGTRAGRAAYAWPLGGSEELARARCSKGMKSPALPRSSPALSCFIVFFRKIR